jgi:predicted peptidase
MKKLLYLIFMATSIAKLHAQDMNMYEKKIFVSKGDTLQYRILYPKDYDKSKAYPVITFLHGSGERGNDNQAQLTHGGKLFLNDTLRDEFRAIVIFPQCPKDSVWRYITSKRDSSMPGGRAIDFSMTNKTSTPTRLMKMLLDSLIKSKVADRKRMYIGGLSLGGFGTFNMIEKYPDYFAAAFPICGGGDTAAAKRFAKNTGVWIFHGDKDPSVNVKYSRDYYTALKKADGDVRYTEYPNVQHNSWDNAFAEKDLVHWLFTKKKK